MEITREFFESSPASNRAINIRRPIYGVGINDVSFITSCKLNGKKFSHPAYVAWKNILTRAFDHSYISKFPTYHNVTVCAEWMVFSSFLVWWKQNYKTGWQLDKDLIQLGNRVYSPSTCVYIPSWINSFTLSGKKNLSTGKVGACYCKKRGKFTSTYSHPLSGQKIRTGYFNSEYEARYYWLKQKANLAFELKQLMDDIDDRIYKNVLAIISGYR